MKKIFLITAVTGVLLAATSITSYAAQWKSDSTGWWWEEDDGSYPVSAWREINGKWYYFGQDGYMLSNTTTPDGYQVGEDGAWILDTSDKLPIAPYADKINQYRNNNGIKSSIIFKKEDLHDYGLYYELKNQGVIGYFYNSDFDYDDAMLLYEGDIYFYKDAKLGDSSVTFEEALNDTKISHGYGSLVEEGYYYWTLWAPDEKGYFTVFYPHHSG